MTQYFVCFTVNIRQSLVPCLFPTITVRMSLGRLILGLERIHKLSQNYLSVTFTYIVILFVIHWHPFVIVIPCHHPHCHFPTLLGPADRLIRFASLSEHHISTFETKRCCHQELINLDSTITKDWRMCTSLARSPKTS